MKKIILLLMLHLSCGTVALSQSRYCVPSNSNPYSKPSLEESFREHELNIEVARLKNSVSSSSNKSQVILTVPIVFHVIHQNGPENIPDSIILNELEQLNNRFSNSAPFNYGNNVNVQIQFCLASVDPYGNPTTGITRDTSIWAVFPAGWGANADATMKNINRWNPYRYLNVWLPKQTVAGMGTNAYSSYPWSIGSPLDGIVIESLSFGFTHFLLAHEVGHYLGLYHLNEGDSCINYNCLLDGDRVCDTPPEYQPIDCAASSCSTDMDDTSGFNPFTMDTIDISNIMLPILPCDYIFTQGQADRMHSFLMTTRQDLLSSAACGQTAPIMALPIAGMSVTASACTGYVFTFTGSGAEYVEWDFNNDGAFDGMGNSVNHVYGGTGYYTVVQRVFNGAGYDTDTLTLFAQSTTNTLFPLTSVTNNNPSNNGGNLCRGAQLTLTAIPNMAQYIWSTGDSTQSISFTVDSAVSVSVTCIDSSGIIWEKCPSPFFTWNVIPSPPYVNLQVLTNDTLCQGDTFKVYVPVPAGNFIGQYLTNGFIYLNQDTIMLKYVTQQHQYLSVILRNANYCRTWLDTAYVHFSLLIPDPITPGVNGYSLFTTDTASHHQWYKDGIIITGATTDTITAFAVGCYSYSAWDIDSSCSTHSQPYCFTTIGIEEKTQNQFQLYPNPAQEYVWITHKNASYSSKLIPVKIYAYNGSEKEILIKQYSNNQWIIDTSELTNGIYLIQIGEETHRVIINK